MADKTKIDTAVTPSLHPGNVRALDGFDDDAERFLGPLIGLMDSVYQSLGDIHAARKQAESDPSLTEAARVLKLAKMAEAHQDKITKRWDSIHSTLQTQIKAMEDQLSAPLKAAAERPGVAGEVRAFVKALTTGERVKFIEERMRVGDVATLQYCLGGPAYLVGLSDEIAATYTRMFNEENHPAVAQRLKVSKAAAELMGNRGGLILTEIVKAIGADWATVSRLRATQDATEQAFIVRDHSVDLGQ